MAENFDKQQKKKNLKTFLFKGLTNVINILFIDLVALCKLMFRNVDIAYAIVELYLSSKN